MTEPGADRVQIDSGLEQVAGARVTDCVRCDPPCGERRHAGGTALDEPIDPEPRIGSSLLAEEDGIAGYPPLHELCERSFGPRPQRTLPMFSPLAVDVDECVPAIASSDLEIARDELRGFGDARAGIVEE